MLHYPKKNLKSFLFEKAIYQINQYLKLYIYWIAFIVIKTSFILYFIIYNTLKYKLQF